LACNRKSAVAAYPHYGDATCTHRSGYGGYGIQKPSTHLVHGASPPQPKPVLRLFMAKLYPTLQDQTDKGPRCKGPLDCREGCWFYLCLVPAPALLRGEMTTLLKGSSPSLWVVTFPFFCKVRWIMRRSLASMGRKVVLLPVLSTFLAALLEIGRASCRERGESWGGGGPRSK